MAPGGQSQELLAKYLADSMRQVETLLRKGTNNNGKPNSSVRYGAVSAPRMPARRTSTDVMVATGYNSGGTRSQQQDRTLPANLRQSQDGSPVQGAGVLPPRHVSGAGLTSGSPSGSAGASPAHRTLLGIGATSTRPLAAPAAPVVPQRSAASAVGASAMLRPSTPSHPSHKSPAHVHSALPPRGLPSRPSPGAAAGLQPTGDRGGVAAALNHQQQANRAAGAAAAAAAAQGSGPGKAPSSLTHAAMRASSPARAPSEVGSHASWWRGGDAASVASYPATAITDRNDSVAGTELANWVSRMHQIEAELQAESSRRRQFEQELRELQATAEQLKSASVAAATIRPLRS